MRRLLVSLMLVYGAASLAHFTHNAEFLREYPNMPGWLSRAGIYAAWSVVAAIGIAGYAVWRRGHAFLGLSLIAVYAALGYDTLSHYALAPFGDHGPSMHVTIWLEVSAATVLLAVVAAEFFKIASEVERRV